MGNGNSRAVHELELVASEIALQQALVVLVKEAIWNPEAKLKLVLASFRQQRDVAWPGRNGIHFCMVMFMKRFVLYM